MPVEIKEMIVRAVIDQGESVGGGGSAGSAHGREDIVADCVKQVLKVLKTKKER